MRRFLGLVLYPKIRNHEDIENLIKRNAYLKGYEFMRFSAFYIKIGDKLKLRFLPQYTFTTVYAIKHKQGILFHLYL